MIRCGNCPHHPDAHSPVGTESCSVRDCPCPGLLTVREAGAVAAERERITEGVEGLAFLTPVDWKERRGGDPIARTINAVLDIVNPEPEP